MVLRPVIASYSGRSYEAIKNSLDARALDLVARIAQTPLDPTQIDNEPLNDLIEMHVLAIRDGLIKLDTAVFLEEDIRIINVAVSVFSSELALLVADVAFPMQKEPPEITNLIVGIVGIGQTLAHVLRDKGLVADWKNYGGKYAQSKVDFDEVCAAYTATGADLQNKTVLRGTRYTAVFIGPGGTSYPMTPSLTTTAQGEYVQELNVFLTDAYAMLVSGELDNIALRSCAERVGLYRDGVPMTSVLTDHVMDRYLPVIDRLRDITFLYISSKLGEIESLLQSTRCGRQGVPPANMMLNFVALYEASRHCQVKLITRKRFVKPGNCRQTGN